MPTRRGLCFAATLAAVSWAHPALAQPPCTPGLPRLGREDLNYPNAVWPNSGIRFRPPGSAYPSNVPNTVLTAAVEAFLERARPTTPLGLPFGPEREIALGGGWIYDNGKSHRGLDYHREDVDSGEDPTFPVLAMGDGIVRAVIEMSPNGGNTIVIEHPHTGPPNVAGVGLGSSWSLYMHLRNGRSNDIANARRIAGCASEAAQRKYRRWARRHPDALAWGRESDTMRVVAGQVVARGEQIAWAGNTGCGAAPGGLEDDGSEKNWKVNTHLHVYYAVEDPALASPGQRIAVMIDPYGVFATADSDCYESPSQRAQFRRHLMPFAPDFHHVEAAALSLHSRYYPALGLRPQTLSVATAGLLEAYAAGSYQEGAAESAIALPGSLFDSATSLHEANGLRLHRPSVRVPADGPPLFTATFERRTTGETYRFFRELDPTIFGLTSTAQAEEGLRVDDYFEYELDGATRIVAGFTSLPGQFFPSLLPDIVLPIADAEAAGGRPATAIHRSLATGAYALTVAPSDECAAVRIALDAAQYQAFYDDFVGARGYRIHHLQAYDDASRYNVIVRRQRVNGACP